MTSSAVPRQTRQRAAVKALLDDVDEFKSAQQVHEDLRAQGASIGLTTVYRALQALADAGEVDRRANADGETVYRKCSEHHHHHLVCRECGATVEIEGPTVEAWVDTVARENGFTSVNHTFEIVGVCAACSR
ncbi:MAG: Fur family transcriptional regulator [Actinomycetes bacterium]